MAEFIGSKRARLIRSCIDGTATEEMRAYYKARLMDPRK